MLLLAFAARSADRPLPAEQVATALNELGWRHSNGRPIERYELIRLDAHLTQVNVTTRTVERDAPFGAARISAAAAALAITALRT